MTIGTLQTINLVNFTVLSARTEDKKIMLVVIYRFGACVSPLKRDFLFDQRGSVGR